MSEDQFLTIKSSSEGFYKEKGSKFLAFALHVQNPDEIKTILQKFRKQYYDARHVCYAYALDYPNTAYMCGDDGEPPHSAGDPILGQIKSKELTNVLVIVVRYFGGTKLGVGGLITAYKTAAENALESSTIISQFICTKVEINYTYEQTNIVMKLVNDYAMDILEQDFQASCTLQAAVRKSFWEACKQALQENMLTYTTS